MNFYEQYKAICSEKGIDPCSQRAAEMFGVTRAAISSWKMKNTMPKGETVAAMANVLNVSADYLLCRTSDPTDYSSQNMAAAGVSPALKQSNDDKNEFPKILSLYNQLDYFDRIRVEAYIEGILTKDKYT